MPPSNSAAWLPAKCVKPLQVGPAPYTPPGPGQIVVKNGAVAFNPVDGAKQLLGDMLLGYIKYPFILGGDVAGSVVEVGADVTRFQVGDRVLGHAVAGTPDSNDPSEGGFQQYTVIREYLASPIPDFISFEQACVLPLCLSTAAYGLFHKDFLGLDMPTVPPRSPNELNKAIVITGGASSVGSNAIQLAVAAGYTVYSTSSPKNFDYVKKLGASRVFDYHSPTFVNDMIAELQGKTLAGAYAIGDGAVEACIQILHQSGGDSKKFVSFAGVPFYADQIQTTVGFVGLIGSTIWRTARTAVMSLARGVPQKFIDGKDLCQVDGVVGAIYRDFLPRALAERQFVPAPPPLVVGTGVEKIQDAIDTQLKGTSAQKVVVSL